MITPQVKASGNVNGVERLTLYLKRRNKRCEMTIKEAAIVSAYTGILIGEFGEFHKYAEKVMGRSIMTHEFAVKITWNELHAATRDDFLGIRIEKEKQDERT